MRKENNINHEYNAEERKSRQSITTPLKAIRVFRLEYMGGNLDGVGECTAQTCWLYPYRMGTNPFRAAKSKRQMEAARRMGWSSSEPT